MTEQKQETTKKRYRSSKEIDFREFEDLIEKAKSGDDIAKEETRILSNAIRESIETSGLGKKISEMFSESSIGIVQDLVRAYIEYFNKEHDTRFENLEELDRYIKENEIKEDISIEKILDVSSTRPKDYVHTVGRLTDKVFQNALTRKKGQVGDAILDLNRKRTISIYASVNYDEVLKDLGENAKVPTLTEDDRQVLDGIISNLVAGNRVMTYDMIYRGFSGKINDMDIYIPEDIYQMINTALDHFRGFLRIDNLPEVNAKGQNTRRIIFDGPILHYDRLQSATINGKSIDGDKIGIIIVHDFPSLYKFAQMNGNEIDTRDIRLLNVPKINNTPENLKIKRYLYNRIIAMRNDYERNVLTRHKSMLLSRRILFSSIFDYIGADIDKSNLGRQKKMKIVQKIEIILEYWKSFGLIDGYHKTKSPGSTSFDGIDISFYKKISENG